MSYIDMITHYNVTFCNIRIFDITKCTDEEVEEVKQTLHKELIEGRSAVANITCSDTRKSEYVPASHLSDFICVCRVKDRDEAMKLLEQKRRFVKLEEDEFERHYDRIEFNTPYLDEDSYLSVYHSAKDKNALYLSSELYEELANAFMIRETMGYYLQVYSLRNMKTDDEYNYHNEDFNTSYRYLKTRIHKPHFPVNIVLKRIWGAISSLEPDKVTIIDTTETSLIVRAGNNLIQINVFEHFVGVSASSTTSSGMDKYVDAILFVCTGTSRGRVYYNNCIYENEITCDKYEEYMSRKDVEVEEIMKVMDDSGYIYKILNDMGSGELKIALFNDIDGGLFLFDSLRDTVISVEQGDLSVDDKEYINTVYKTIPTIRGEQKKYPMNGHEDYLETMKELNDKSCMIKRKSSKKPNMNTTTLSRLALG